MYGNESESVFKIVEIFILLKLINKFSMNFHDLVVESLPPRSGS